MASVEGTRLEVSASSGSQAGKGGCSHKWRHHPRPTLN